MFVQLDSISGFLKSFEESDYILVYECLIANLLRQVDARELSLSDTLSICIVIVSCGNPKLFHTASTLLSSLEGLGGAYWVVQVELIRHYVIDMISNASAMDVVKVHGSFRHVSHHAKIRYEVDVMLSELEVINLDDATIEEKHQLCGDYKLKYPLDMFQTWFVDWANRLLHRIHELKPTRFQAKQVEDDMIPSKDIDNSQPLVEISLTSPAIIEDYMEASDHGNGTVTMIDEVSNHDDATCISMSPLSSLPGTNLGLSKHIVNVIWDFFTPPLRPAVAISNDLDASQTQE